MNTPQTIKLIILILPFFLFSGCKNNNLGDCFPVDNMSHVKIYNNIADDNGKLSFVFTWDLGTDKGAELPNEYFSKVGMYHTNEDIEEVVYIEPNQIEIVFSSIAIERLKNDLLQSLEIELLFPDREGYIDCSHKGMRDLYILTLNLKIENANIIELTAIENIIIGDI